MMGNNREKNTMNMGIVLPNRFLIKTVSLPGDGKGWQDVLQKYNKQGRIIETANYGTDGNLCFNKKKKTLFE